MKGTPLHHHYQQAYRAHRNLKRRLEKALLVKVKERYKIEQPVIDIQRQLKGLPVAERVRAINTLFTFAHIIYRRGVPTAGSSHRCVDRTL